LRVDRLERRQLGRRLVAEPFEVGDQARWIAVLAEEQLEEQDPPVLERVFIGRVDPFGESGAAAGRDPPQVLVGSSGLADDAPPRVARSLKARQHVVDVALRR
jgi:hypothetical protein